MVVSDELAVELLRTFARVEFGLHHFPNFVRGNDRRAQTEWSQLHPLIRDNDAYLDRVASRHQDVLLGNHNDGPPPKKMVIGQDGTVSFENIELDGNCIHVKLLDAALRVRNNLVHGGKERDADERSFEHSRRCVEASIAVVRSAAQTHDGTWRLLIG